MNMLSPSIPPLRCNPQHSHTMHSALQCTRQSTGGIAVATNGAAIQGRFEVADLRSCAELYRSFSGARDGTNCDSHGSRSAPVPPHFAICVFQCAAVTHWIAKIGRSHQTAQTRTQVREFPEIICHGERSV